MKVLRRECDLCGNVVEENAVPRQPVTGSKTGAYVYTLVKCNGGGTHDDTEMALVFGQEPA